MKILYDEISFLEEASVAALGMFDGVHIGHQELIRNAVTLAKSMNARSVVCTFDRHPLSVLRPERAPKPLLTLQQNLLKFERLGADYALVKAFTPEFAATEPEAYLRSLVEKMRHGAPNGYTTIIVVICFMFSVLFLLVGIIGQYIWILFQEIKARPIYLVEETVNFPEKPGESGKS